MPRHPATRVCIHHRRHVPNQLRIAQRSCCIPQLVTHVDNVEASCCSLAICSCRHPPTLGQPSQHWLQQRLPLQGVPLTREGPSAGVDQRRISVGPSRPTVSLYEEHTQNEYPPPAL